MRQGPHSKRGRGRGGNRRPNVPNRNQTFDSNGPDVRIRGNAHQVYEKYLTLARDASTSGDRVLAESLYQHADHYFRIYNAFNEENEARRNASQQDNNPPQGDNSPREDDEDSGTSTDAAQSQPQSESGDDEQGAARRTRSERRQDAEAAEQAEKRPERAPRQPRRRRTAPAEEQSKAEDNDSALRAMLGASEAGVPKEATPSEAAAEDAPEEKPVRRRGRPRKTPEAAEPALPLAGED